MRPARTILIMQLSNSRAEDIFEYGIESMITTINGVMTLPEALDHAEELYLGAARRLFRMLRAGSRLL